MKNISYYCGSRYRQRNFRYERGAATLLITVVLLLVLSLVAAYTSRSSLLDLNIIGTQARLKEAQSLTEAALDCALAQYLANGLLETGTGARTPPQILQQECEQRDLAGLAGAVQLFYLKTIEVDPTNGLSQATLFNQCPANVTNQQLQTQGANSGHLYAIGRSADGSSVYCTGLMVSSQMAIGSSASRLATITAGVALPSKLTGNLTVVNNNPGGVTIWTGTDIGSMSGSFTTKIAINGSNNQTSSGKDGSKFFVGPDVVFNDPQVRNLATDSGGQPLSFSTYYQNMLGTQLANVIAGADQRLGAGQALPSVSDAYAGQVIYVNPGAGSFDPNMNLGTADKPVLLIVEGDLQLNGNNTIHGLVVARNLKRLNGTVNIVGNMLTQTIEDLNGNLTVTAPPTLDPTDLGSPRNFWMHMPVAGTWRDWPRQP